MISEMKAEEGLADSRDPQKRWTAKAKKELVIRILRGESMEEISRQSQVELYRLQEWRDKALLGMEEAMKAGGQKTVVERALEDAQTTIGRLTMELEVFRGKAQRSQR